MEFLKKSCCSAEAVSDKCYVLNELLPYSSWGTECDPNFKGYHDGNDDPLGFGECCSKL